MSRQRAPTAPWRYNPAMGSAPLFWTHTAACQVAAIVALPAVTLMLASWAGRGEIRRAQFRKDSDPRRWAAVILVLALVVFPAPLLRSLALIALMFFGLVRGLQLLVWSASALRAPARRAPHLAQARAGRLAAAGLLTVWAAAFLGSFAMPPQLYRAAEEGATRGRLGTLREALARHHSENGGRYPVDLAGLPSLPAAIAPYYHPASAAVRLGTSSDDGGGWLYNNVEGHSEYGGVWVNCTHTDSKIWRWDRF